MNVIPFALLVAAMLAGSACASPSVAQRSSREAQATPKIAYGPGSGSHSSGEPADTAEFYDDVLVHDPWERYNRRIYGFNSTIDKIIFRPLAVGYDKVVPDLMQSGISRFFDNLNLPATAANQTLQAHPIRALRSLGRFAVNSTMGIGGFFDPASHVGMSRPHDQDFGQTFAAWGWRDSRYLVLPLLGPRTVRDAIALVGDRALSPLNYVDDSTIATSLQLLKAADIRSRLLPLDQVRHEAYDEYALVRDAWAQHRRHQIGPDRPDDKD